ncbi:hypothetical protein ACVMHZ_007397 [Bradyrhizobium liaoningense]
MAASSALAVARLRLRAFQGQRAGAGAERQEREGRNARQGRQHQHHCRGHRQCLRIAGELLHQRLVGGAGDAGLGDEQAGRRRDDQRRHLGDETVTDGQERVGAAGVGEGHALLRHTDDDAADHVDEDDQEAGDGIAADELGGTIHRAEEAALVLQLLAPLLGDLLVDQAGGEVGVDRHLLAGHGVEVEARGDLGDTARTLGDDDEVDDDQDGEDDDADDEIAAHHEVAEGLDDVTGGGRALVPVRQDQAGRGHVERQAQHGRDQEDGREGREFERRLNEQRRHQDQDRERDRDRQEQVQHDRGQGKDQHHQDGEDAERQRDVAALEDVDDLVEGGDAGLRAAYALSRRDVDHGSCLPARLPSARPKRLRGGRWAAVPKVRHRTGVHGSSRSTRLTTLDFTRQFLPGVWLAKG